jgi:hypothetical protein
VDDAGVLIGCGRIIAGTPPAAAEAVVMLAGRSISGYVHFQEANVIRRSQLSVLIFSRQEMTCHHFKNLLYFLPLREDTSTGLLYHRLCHTHTIHRVSVA